MALARQRLNERAHRYFGPNYHEEILTKEFNETTGRGHSQRWICTIKYRGSVIATSTNPEATRQVDAYEEAAHMALNWMTASGRP